jgi:FkbM family methyltransferase
MKGGRLIRALALKAGVSIEPQRNTPAARLAQLLEHYGVDLVLDIGANEGEYGSQLRHNGFPGQIASFEPLPEAHRVLERRSRPDPRWTAHNCALGDRATEETLHIAGNHAATSSSILPMLTRHSEAAPDADYRGSVPVSVKRLDEIWTNIATDQSVVFVKVDVQGYEGQVLDGIGSCLDAVSGFQLEISLTPLYEGTPSMWDILSRMESAGFALAQIFPGFVDTRTGELLQFDGVFFRR